MVTKVRKSKEIKKTALDTFSSDSKIIVICFKNDKFYVRSAWYPDLYQQYITRKDIKVDFSDIKTPEDLAVLREKFIKRYKNAPTQEQIDAADKEYEEADKNYENSIQIEHIARAIIHDLSRIDSDKKYKQTIKYLKETIKAVANGENINNIKEQMPVIKQIINKITFTDDALKNLKSHVNEFKDYIHDIPKDLWLKLIENLPKEKFMSVKVKGVVNEYLEPFSKNAKKNMDIHGDKYANLAIILLNNKIKVDAIRTFDLLAKQHMDKLKKKEANKKSKAFKDTSSAIKRQKGLVYQKIVNMYGPVDPVARSIAKIRKQANKR